MKINNNFVKNLICYDEVDSTNNAAKAYDCVDTTLFVANKQTAGKGRMGRVWQSEEGAGIYMSLALLPDMEVEKVMQITLISALAVREAICDFCGVSTQIKWPNDIVYEGKKLCGILTEATVEKGVAKKVIAGIGVNVNNTAFADDISQIATSLKLITGMDNDREKLINRIIDKFEAYYKMLTDQRLDEIIAEYKKHCVNIGKKVTFVYKNENVQATATDLTPAGELVAKKDDGTTITVNSGEVSVKGIYGCI